VFCPNCGSAKTSKKKKVFTQNTVDLARKAPKPPKLRDLWIGVFILIGGTIGLLIELDLLANGFGSNWFALIDALGVAYGIFSIVRYFQRKVQYQEIENRIAVRSTQPEQVGFGDERRGVSQRKSTGLRGSFPLDAETIDDQVAQVSPGVYALGTKEGNIFHVHYVGRSDIDVRAELKEHVGKYDRFKFDYTDQYSPDAAFLKECQLYHDFGGPEGKLDNQRHPDRPSDAVSCPICGDSVQKTSPTGPSESNPPKQFCVKCGTTLPLGSKFCNKCGTQQP
jgi:hypothetical protein